MVVEEEEEEEEDDVDANAALDSTLRGLPGAWS